MANNSEVAHAWANKTGKQRRGSNLFYEDDTIYSYGYHFAIATHVAGVVLFNGSRYYSNSTSGHQCHVRRACSHLTVFDVPHVRPVFGNTETMHRRNMDSYRKQIEEEVGRARRARTYTRHHVEDSEGLADEWKRYAKHFKLGRTYAEKLLIPEPERQELLDKSDERRRIDEARRAENHAEHMRLLEERRVRQEAEEVEKLERWMAGEDVGRTFYTKRIRLRVKDNKVETSHGASVPREEARGLYVLSRRWRDSGKWWKAGPESTILRVGDFQVSAVNEAGIVVGCHRMDWEEIDRLASNEGWQ